LGQMAHHLAIDSAAVVASIAAIIGTEIVIKTHEFSAIPTHENLSSFFFVISAVSAVFAITVLLSGGGRHGSGLERASIAVAAFCAGVALAAWGLPLGLMATLGETLI